MMPMPPTSREIAAMAESMMLIVCMALSICSIIVCMDMTETEPSVPLRCWQYDSISDATEEAFATETACTMMVSASGEGFIFFA